MQTHKLYTIDSITACKVQQICTVYVHYRCDDAEPLCSTMPQEIVHLRETPAEEVVRMAHEKNLHQKAIQPIDFDKLLNPLFDILK